MTRDGPRDGDELGLGRVRVPGTNLGVHRGPLTSARVGALCRASLWANTNPLGHRLMGPSTWALLRVLIGALFWAFQGPLSSGKPPREGPLSGAPAMLGLLGVLFWALHGLRPWDSFSRGATDRGACYARTTLGNRGTRSEGTLGPETAGRGSGEKGRQQSGFCSGARANLPRRQSRTAP